MSLARAPHPAVERGDASLTHLYRSHASWLRGLLRLRFGADQAEDLVQETFLRVSRTLGDATIRHPKALLLRIAANAARDSFRRRAVRIPSAGGSADANFPEVAAFADQTEALLLKQVILGLPPLLREVFILNRFEGLTYDEIARRCGVSVKTVEWRMSKALSLCAARLGG